MTPLAMAGELVAIIIGGGGLFSMLWAVGHVKGLDATVSLLQMANGELRDEVTHEREHRHQDRLECAREIARLEGHVQALTDGLGDKIAISVLAAMRHHDAQVRDPENVRSG